MNPIHGTCALPGSAKKGSEQPPSKMTRRDRAQKDVLPSESGGSQLSGYGPSSGTNLRYMPLLRLMHPP